MYLMPNEKDQYINKITFLRLDFNIPKLNNQILNLNKIILCIPTIKFLLKQKIKIVLISHLGNPLMKDYCEKYSLYNICKIISVMLKENILFLKKLSIQKIVSNSSQIIIIDNIRFYYYEKFCGVKSSKLFSFKIDLYLNNAFGTIHREHTSLYGIKKFIKNSRIGFLMEKEINSIKYIIMRKKLDLIVSGGSKTISKILIIKKLLKYNELKYLIFGSRSSRFVGNKYFFKNFLFSYNSLFGRDFILKKKCKKLEVMDLGHFTIKKYINYLNKSNIILWNGPLGFFEKEEFGLSTIVIFKNMILKKNNFFILGGGESSLPVEYLNFKNDIAFLSTGGGSLLSFFSKKNIYY